MISVGIVDTANVSEAVPHRSEPTDRFDLSCRELVIALNHYWRFRAFAFCLCWTLEEREMRDDFEDSNIASMNVFGENNSRTPLATDLYLASTGARMADIIGGGSVVFESPTRPYSASTGATMADMIKGTSVVLNSPKDLYFVGTGTRIGDMLGGTSASSNRRQSIR